MYKLKAGVLLFSDEVDNRYCGVGDYQRHAHVMPMCLAQGPRPAREST